MLSKPASIKKGCYTCQWLDNADMNLHEKIDQNIPCGSKKLLMLHSHAKASRLILLSIFYVRKKLHDP